MNAINHNTKISWMVAMANLYGLKADVTNPLRGCTPLGKGCLNCWAADVAARRACQSNPKVQERYGGLTAKNLNGNSVFNGSSKVLKRDFKRISGKPRAWFHNSEGDTWFEQHYRNDIDELIGRAALRPNDIHVFLTKRFEEMSDYFVCLPDRIYEWDCHSILDSWDGKPLSNFLLGVSVWDQKSADAARPFMQKLAKLGWRVWVSYEPALDQVDWTGWEFLSWLVTGCHSATQPLPHERDWERAARDFCQANNIPFFDKQIIIKGKKIHIPKLDNITWDQVPEMSQKSLPENEQ
ncbi:MAG: DUF5131 family protein [Rhodospirillales bacterium]|nr:DUF5131 family protein [Rhodospirillales bacterium]